jgi:hypothetical protein
LGCAGFVYVSQVGTLSVLCVCEYLTWGWSCSEFVSSPGEDGGGGGGACARVCLGAAAREGILI